MPNHKCNGCNKLFAKKYDLDRHLKKKNKCQMSPQNTTMTPQNTAKSPQNTAKSPQNTANLSNEKAIVQNEIHQCPHCNKSLARKDALNRHINQYCPIVKQNNKEKQEIFDKLLLLESKNKELEKEINNIKSTTINSNSNNINNNSNNTTNNIINVNVVPHGEEDLSKYSNLLLVLAAKRGINAVLELTDRIHFNSQLPEFQNVYIPDIKNKHAMVFNKVWELKNTDEVISNIYDTKSDYIKDNEDVFINHLSVGEKLVYQRWVLADRNRDTAEYKAYINSMHDKIKLLLYNKRNMVIETKKLQIK